MTDAPPYQEAPPAGGLLAITAPGLLWGQPVTYTFEPQQRRCVVKFLELELEVTVEETELELPAEALEAFGRAFKRAIESNAPGFQKLRQQAARAQRALERELSEPALPQEGDTGDGGAITTAGVPTRR